MKPIKKTNRVSRVILNCCGCACFLCHALWLVLFLSCNYVKVLLFLYPIVILVQMQSTVKLGMKVHMMG